MQPTDMVYEKHKANRKVVCEAFLLKHLLKSQIFITFARS